MSSLLKKKMKREEESLKAAVYKLMKEIESRQNNDECNCDSEEASEILPAHPNDVDMKHLAPLCVEESEEWPKHVTISSIRNSTVRYYRKLDSYKGSWHPIMAKMSGDYYKINKNNHFVWTNQNVVGRRLKWTLN